MEPRRKIILATVFVGLVLLANTTFDNVGEKSVLPYQSEQIDEPHYLNFQDYVIVQSEDGELLLIPKEDVTNIDKESFVFITNEKSNKIAVATTKKLPTRSSTSPFIENEDPNVIGKFSSFEEMNGYVENNTEEFYYNGPYDGAFTSGSSKVTEGSALGHSETNVQVTGVDEGDLVKTDGEYAYMVSKDGCNVFIADVQSPENPEIVSTINSRGSIREIYIRDNILVVIGQRAVFQIDPSPVSEKSEYWSVLHKNMNTKFDIGQYYYLNYLYYQATFIDVFDIKDKHEPNLMSFHVIKGIHLQSRMIEDCLYVITSYTINRYFQEYDLPVPASEIYYLNPLNDTEYFGYYLQLTSILSIDITEPSEIVDMRVILMSASNTIYVSRNNIYITYYNRIHISYNGKTSLHRIAIHNGNIRYMAYGEIEGKFLDRFSMDEYEGFFRVAVSIGWSSSHRVYVLDMDLNMVGCLEGIAPDERLCSARFMGDRLYLVTFRRVDPFFVINLTDPTAPEVLGELIIPGWSDYLHPYDENHIIGLGREADENGWAEGIKFSLFNVSDVENPEEVSKFVIGNRWSSTLAADEPHAFLFSRERNLIVIPVIINYTYRCAYVINISLEGGFELRGEISHPDIDQNEMGYYGYYNRISEIKRTFYIHDTLFSLSDSYLQLNDLNDLTYINRLKLPNEPQSVTEGQIMCFFFEPISP